MVPAIVLIIYVGFAALIVWRPSSVIALALCIYPFEQWAQAKSAIFAQHSTLLNYGLGILTLLALACVVIRGKNPLQPLTRAYVTWLALYFYAAVSIVWSPDRETSAFLFQYHLPYVVTFVGLLPLVVVDVKDVKHGLFLTLLFGTAVMILLLGGTRIHAWGRTIEVEHGVAMTDRFATRQITRMSPLAVAGTAGHIMLIAILLNYRGANRIWQIGRWIVAFMAMALIFRSGSRGQLLAAVLTIVAFIGLSRGYKRFTGIAFAGVSLIIVGAFVVVSFGAFADPGGRWDVSTMEETFKSTRLEMVATLLAYWAQGGIAAWLFGIGSSASFDSRLLGIYCHVLPVEILCELGVIGLTGYIAFVTFVVKDCMRLYRACAEDMVERGVATAAIAIFFFQLILTMKEGSFLTHTYTLGWGIIISRYASLKLSQVKKEARASAMRKWYAFQFNLANQGVNQGMASQQVTDGTRPLTS